MPLKVTNAGELVLLDWLLRSAGAELVLKLYSNDYTPVDGSTPANFTEATFGGYTSRSLARATWNAPATNVDGKAEIAYSVDQVYNPTTAQTIYGYYVTNSAGTTVVFAERFAAPRSLLAGDPLTVLPRFTLASDA